MNRKTNLLLLAVILTLTAFACNFVTPTEATQPPTATTVVESTSYPLTLLVEPTAVPTRNDLPRDEAAVPRVPVEQAKAALDSGAAIIVDVRAAQSYEQEHIAGSISIPLAEIEANPTGLKLDKNQWIITYCT